MVHAQRTWVAQLGLCQPEGVIEYKGFTREEPLRFDVLVEGCVLLEAKAVEKILPIHKAQLLSYMKLLDVPIWLLINFHFTGTT